MVPFEKSIVSALSILLCNEGCRTYSRMETIHGNIVHAISFVKVQVNIECYFKKCFIALCGGDLVNLTPSHFYSMKLRTTIREVCCVVRSNFSYLNGYLQWILSLSTLEYIKVPIIYKKRLLYIVADMRKYGILHNWFKVLAHAHLI